MSTTDLKPEQKARKIIDQMLNVAGWDIVDRKHYTTLSSAAAIIHYSVAHCSQPSGTEH